MSEPDVEVWQNNTKGLVLVNKFNHDGQVVQEPVGPQRKVVVTPKERSILNTQRTYAAENDAFQNGVLVPLSLADEGSDLEENPNHITLDGMRDLFKIRNALKFKSAIGDISSVSVLQRLGQLAESGDEELDVTFNQVNVISEAIKALTGEEDVAEVEVISDGSGGDDRRSVAKFRAE